MALFSQIKTSSLREQVVEQVRTAIIEGRLRPNDHIVEATLTQQLGVSRTPVREALILLEREGLVVSSPNRGCFVRAFTEQDVINLFSMRTTLENFAAELIIEQLQEMDFTYLESLIEAQEKAIQQHDFKTVRRTDMAFHQYLVHSSQHPVLIRSWSELVAQVAAVLYLRAEAIRDYDESLAIGDHRAIIAAYRNRDLDGLRTLNRHINERVAAECRYAVKRLA